MKEGVFDLKYDTDLLNKAYTIACKAHEGQVDKAGVDYINHPVTVASYVNSEEEKVVALLHDVLEDSETTAEELLIAGIPEHLVDAVKVLTKPRKESYFSYIEGVKKNSLSRAVKLADLKHNSQLSRLPQITEKDQKRIEKYQKASAFLQADGVESFKDFEG